MMSCMSFILEKLERKWKNKNNFQLVMMYFSSLSALYVEKFSTHTSCKQIIIIIEFSV